MQITTGKYHTLLINNSSVYSCGSGLCGVLGQGPETTQCVAFTRIGFPPLARVVHVSASYNHAAFVTQSGEVCSSLTFIQFVMNDSWSRPIMMFSSFGVWFYVKCLER